jgi:sugar phosphate isomerase/epimerase
VSTTDERGRGVINRRRLLASTAAAAIGASALGNLATAGAHGRHGGEDDDDRHRHDDGKIPRRRRGAMLYSVRDLVANDPALYPTLPAGYRQVFEALATLGFTGIEFFSFSGAPSFAQHANAEGGANVPPEQIRAWLDEFGLRASGHYNGSFIPPSTVVGLTPETIDAALQTAQILGQPHTGSHDATGTMRQKAEIDAVIATWNAMAEKAKAAGIPIYSHTHAEPWDFLLDSGPQDASGNYTRSSGIRVMEYFLDHTDTRWVKLEMDIFWAHVAQFRFSTYTAPDGSTATSVFDPAATAGRYKRRCPIFHAKDGIRAPADPNGWIFCPFGYGDIDLEDFFDRSRSRKTRPWWSYEQDNAPGDAADPQKSLRDSANSYRGMATLGSRRGVGAPFAGV